MMTTIYSFSRLVLFLFCFFLLTPFVACASSIPSMSDITASLDPVIVERGRYLVFGPAGCARCHTDRDKLSQLQAGTELPLVGGRHWANSLGDIYAANITPDNENGIGRWSDGEIARAIRHGVDNNDQLLAPMMEYGDIKEEDLVAIVSYLRTVTPVANKVPDSRWSIVGRIAKAFVLKPKMPSNYVYGERGANKEYGEYLAKVLSHCVACHTERNQSTGKFVGAPLAGGTRFPHEKDSLKVVVPPNITSDRKTGVIAGWSEDQFIARMRSGPGVAMTHMPWGAFKRTDDQDLRAIYRYLMSVKPIEKDNGAIVQRR